jgi:hypothetical protein
MFTKNSWILILLWKRYKTLLKKETDGSITDSIDKITPFSKEK